MMTVIHRRWRRLSFTVAVCVTSLMVAACGSADDTSGTVATGAAAPGLDEAKKNLESYFANTSVGPPSEGPRAVKGKSVYYVSAGTGSPSGSQGVADVREAGKTLGWDITVFDGRFSSSVQSEGLRQAISNQADGIIVYGIDCATNKQALEEVAAAKVPVVGLDAVDCNATNRNQESLYTRVTTYPPDDAKPLEHFAELGVAQADWILVATDGKAKVIQFRVDAFPPVKATSDGAAERLKTNCPTCEIVETIRLGVEDFGPALQEKAAQALLSHPDANAILVPYDDLMTLGLARAVVTSGRNDDLAVVAGNGYEPNMDLVRENGGQDAGFVVDSGWTHYAALDAMNRIFADAPEAAVGQPVTMFDADHNAGTSGPFKYEADYKDTFEKVWTGGQ